MGRVKDGLCQRLRRVETEQRNRINRLIGVVADLKLQQRAQRGRVANLRSELSAAELARSAARVVGTLGRLVQRPGPGALGQAVTRTTAELRYESVQADLQDAESDLTQLESDLSHMEFELHQTQANLPTTLQDLHDEGCI